MSQPKKTASQSRLPDPTPTYDPEQARRFTQTVEKDLGSLFQFSSSWVRYREANPTTTLTATTANTTATVKAGHVIKRIYIYNTTANAVTGGIKIGTTNGGTELISSITVGANDFCTLDTAYLLSTTSDTTIYIQAVTAWNSASLDIVIQMEDLY